MTYDDMKLDDRQVLDVLGVARREGAMTMVHAENSDCIAWLTERLEAAGHTEPKYHAASRPAPVEREATHRAATLAEIADSPVLIVHVSGAEAIDQIRAAQARGVRVYAETCRSTCSSPRTISTWRASKAPSASARRRRATPPTRRRCGRL